MKKLYVIFILFTFPISLFACDAPAKSGKNSSSPQSFIEPASGSISAYDNCISINVVNNKIEQEDKLKIWLEDIYSLTHTDTSTGLSIREARSDVYKKIHERSSDKVVINHGSSITIEAFFQETMPRKPIVKIQQAIERAMAVRKFLFKNRTGLDEIRLSILSNENADDLVKVCTIDLTKNSSDNFAGQP